MPAILRKSLPRLLPSICYFASYESYAIVDSEWWPSARHRRHLGNGMLSCNTMRCRRCVYRGVAVASGPQLTSILAKSAWLIGFDRGGW